MLVLPFHPQHRRQYETYDMTTSRDGLDTNNSKRCHFGGFFEFGGFGPGFW